MRERRIRRIGIGEPVSVTWEAQHELKTSREVFEFAADRIGQKVKIEQPTYHTPEGLPEFGFILADVIQSVRYFDQTEQALIHFENGGSINISRESIENGLALFPEVSN